MIYSRQMQQALCRRRPSCRCADAVSPIPTPRPCTSSVTIRSGRGSGSTPVQSAVLIALGSCRGVRCSAGTMQPQLQTSSRSQQRWTEPSPPQQPRSTLAHEHRDGTWIEPCAAGTPNGINICHRNTQISMTRTRPIPNTTTREARGHRRIQTIPATRSRSPIPNSRRPFSSGRHLGALRTNDRGSACNSPTMTSAKIRPPTGPSVHPPV